jgi:hypothetical protein
MRETPFIDIRADWSRHFRITIASFWAQLLELRTRPFWRTRRSRPTKSLAYDSQFSGNVSRYCGGVGRERGVGRDLGVALGVAVGDGVAVGVGLAVGVPVGVWEAVGVGVGVGCSPTI